MTQYWNKCLSRISLQLQISPVFKDVAHSVFHSPLGHYLSTYFWQNVTKTLSELVCGHFSAPAFVSLSLTCCSACQSCLLSPAAQSWDPNSMVLMLQHAQGLCSPGRNIREQFLEQKNKIARNLPEMILSSGSERIRDWEGNMAMMERMKKRKRKIIKSETQNWSFICSGPPKNQNKY